MDRVNAPALAGAAVIASHPPAQPLACENHWEVDHSGDEALRVTAPSLTTCNRTTPVSADRPIIATHNEAATDDKNILKCVSTVSADLQHTTVKA